jgi:hypothetical protein
MAFCAMDLPVSSALVMATNHWSVSIGSMIWPVRAQRGTISLCFLVSMSRPCASRSATMALRATKRFRPRYFSGASSLIVASRLSTPIMGNPWRCPTA